MYRIDDLSWREREWRDSGQYKALYIEGISSLGKNEGGDQHLTSSRVVTDAKCRCMLWDVLLGSRTLHRSIWQSFSKSPSSVCLCDGCCRISWERYNCGSLWCTTTLEAMGQKGIEGWWMIEEIFECILSWRMASRMIFQVRLAGRWLRKTHQICHFPLPLKECTHHQIQFISWVLFSSEYSSGASRMFTMLSRQSAFMLLPIRRQQHLRHVSASNYIENVQFVGYTL